jgi:chorismate mutase
MSNLIGIRGAITVKENSKPEIIKATTNLLKKMTVSNKVKVNDIASIIFSMTYDLDAEFPAAAARKLGWKFTPLLCTNEVDVPGSIKKCIRVLMLVNSEKKQAQIKHIYLGAASKLRPDLR